MQLLIFTSLGSRCIDSRYFKGCYSRKFVIKLVTLELYMGFVYCMLHTVLFHSLGMVKECRRNFCFSHGPRLSIQGFNLLLLCSNWKRLASNTEAVEVKFARTR
jgi:hypothetical protein